MSRKTRAQERRAEARNWRAQDNSLHLPKSVYEDSSIGKLAISLLDGEDAACLFSLLASITGIGLSGKNISMEGLDGEIITLDGFEDFPIIVLAGHPQTLAIAQHLEAIGYLKLEQQNPHGHAFIICAPEKSLCADWAGDVFGAIDAFVKQRRNQPPKYVKMLLQQIEGKVLSEISVANVYHDNWCSLINGTGSCNCEPEVAVQ